MGPRANIRRISMSSVPCTSSPPLRCFGIDRLYLDGLYLKTVGTGCHLRIFREQWMSEVPSGGRTELPVGELVIRTKPDPCWVIAYPEVAARSRRATVLSALATRKVRSDRELATSQIAGVLGTSSGVALSRTTSSPFRDTMEEH